MKKKKGEKKETAIVAGTWKPETPGETAEGKYKTMLRGTFDGKPAWNMVLGEQRIKVTLVIGDFIRSNPKLFKLGAQVKCEYTGKSGRTKTYRMWVNGVELKREGLFDTTPASVGDFLGQK